MEYEKYDSVILGGGIFGLYSAKILIAQKKRVALIEVSDQLLSKASRINQARLHQGYHYPRSTHTSINSLKYVNLFNDEFGDAINSSFEHIYAIPKRQSNISSENFYLFSKQLNLEINEIKKEKYNLSTFIDKAFKVKEFGFDINIIYQKLISSIEHSEYIDVFLNTSLIKVNKKDSKFNLEFSPKLLIETSQVVNSTYSNINFINNLFNEKNLNLKHELCEVIYCSVPSDIKNIGYTVMDGPFFSLMPFGNSKFHTLTSVEYTPHYTSEENIPIFNCQKKIPNCGNGNILHCSSCEEKPLSNWNKMNNVAKKYLNLDKGIKYEFSKFIVKTLLNDIDVHDSRPTVIQKTDENNSNFISVLSGKINTIFDLKEVL